MPLLLKLPGHVLILSKTRLSIVENSVSLKIKVKSTHAIHITVLMTRMITERVILTEVIVGMGLFSANNPSKGLSSVWIIKCLP